MRYGMGWLAWPIVLFHVHCLPQASGLLFTMRHNCCNVACPCSCSHAPREAIKHSAPASGAACEHLKYGTCTELLHLRCLPRTSQHACCCAWLARQGLMGCGASQLSPAAIPAVKAVNCADESAQPETSGSEWPSRFVLLEEMRNLCCVTMSMAELDTCTPSILIHGIPATRIPSYAHYVESHPLGCVTLLDPTHFVLQLCAHRAAATCDV